MQEKCTVLRLSELETFSIRLDAEHYRPIFIETEHSLKRNEWDYLENLSESVTSFGAYALNNQFEYSESGIPFLRATDIKEGHIDFSNVLRIDSEAHELLWKSEIKPETVLLTMSGTVGNSSITHSDMTYPINSSQDVAKIITNRRLNPYYLSSFLQSHYGRTQTSRLPIGSVQQHIFLWQINKLIIPMFDEMLQSNIEDTFRSALSSQKQADSIYGQAQAMLLSELGLADWQPKHQTESVRNFSDVWGAGRMDAEYFQPKYDEIVDAIRGYSGGWDTLGSLVRLKDRNFNPDADTEYKYIELANIRGNGEISDCMIAEGDELPSRARRKVAVGDVIVSSVEGSLESIALVDDEHDGALCSTGFHVVNSQTFNSETLLVLLKSIVGQMQLKKGCSGTILTAINKEELRKVILPIVSDEIQAEIQRKVKEASELRRRSRELLECAKRAVEIAIEDGEAAAMAWLEESAAAFTSSKPPFRVRPNNSGFVEGIDPLHLNRLLDDLDVEEFLAKNPK